MRLNPAAGRLRNLEGTPPGRYRRRGRSATGQYAGGPGSRGRPAWNRGLSGYRPDIAEAICDRLCLGETLQSVCRDPEMPSVGTVYNWLRAHPEFVDLYRRAKEIAFAYIAETAAEQAP